MKLRALSDKVIVEVSKAEEVSKGGIIIAEQAKEEKAEGTVKSVGRDVESVGIGSRVIFGKFAGDEIACDGKPYRVISESDLLAVYK